MSAFTGIPDEYPKGTDFRKNMYSPRDLNLNTTLNVVIRFDDQDYVTELVEVVNPVRVDCNSQPPPILCTQQKVTDPHTHHTLI